MPVQEFNFDSQIARFVKFEAFSWFGVGAGLQYFNVKKTGILVFIERYNSSFSVLTLTFWKTFLDCGVTVQSGDVYDNDAKFKVSNVLDRFGNNSWIPSNGQSKEFILKLGCKEETYNVVQLVNTNLNQERSTGRFKVYLR